MLCIESSLDADWWLDVLRDMCRVNTAKEEVKAEVKDYIRWMKL